MKFITYYSDGSVTEVQDSIAGHDMACGLARESTMAEVACYESWAARCDEGIAYSESMGLGID